MTFEDFFTPNELENGLTDLDRVNELITGIQSEKDLEGNSFDQTTRQWSKVTTIIAATENKDCLDLFIKLNGVSVFGKWLKDAQKLKSDDENDLLEEIIISLLRALEKLPTDDKRLFSSGIMQTVQDLAANNNHTIRERAKELCDNWILIQDKSKISQEAKNSDNVESPPDNSMDTDTKNQEPLDYVDPSCKSTVDDDNGEQIASVVDVDNSLESCIKIDHVLSDKDDDVADGGEDPKMSSNSDRDNGASNKIIGVQSNGNPENELNFSKLSTNHIKSDMELNYGMIDPLDIARQVAFEVEREVDSTERSCSTSGSRDCQEIQSQSQNRPVGGFDMEVSPKPVKDAETLVSQTSEVAQESELNTGRPLSGFDLNQEVCSEDPGTLNNSNQRSGFRDFDLNVADGGQEDKIVIIPGLPSGEESCVAYLRKPERLQWDLNSIGDDQNGWQSPYHASSSLSSSSTSSSKQPILRNIDLNINDQPNGEDSVISIFGATLELKRNDHTPQLEPKFDFNFCIPQDSSVGYGHHNGMFSNTPMYAAASSSSSSSYGMPMPTPTPMAYMVDSRGTPFTHQMMGSHPPSPFVMTMAAAGAPFGASGHGPLQPPPPQHDIDLNTDSMINGGLRQFLPQSVNEQASSSSVLGKRHEPDSNWQFFPVNKRQQPPWM